MRNKGDTEVVSGGIGFFGLLTIVFIVLKLGAFKTTVMGWSWWWVFAPLWIPPLVFIGIVLIIVVIALIIGRL